MVIWLTTWLMALSIESRQTRLSLLPVGMEELTKVALQLTLDQEMVVVWSLVPVFPLKTLNLYNSIQQEFMEQAAL